MQLKEINWTRGPRYMGQGHGLQEALKRVSENFKTIQEEGTGGGLNSINSITVPITDDPLANGIALMETYEAAKALTPNGAPLGPFNRATVFVPPAEYDLGLIGGALPIFGYEFTTDAEGANPIDLEFLVIIHHKDDESRTTLLFGIVLTGDDTTEAIVQLTEGHFSNLEDVGGVTVLYSGGYAEFSGTSFDLFDSSFSGPTKEQGAFFETFVPTWIEEREGSKEFVLDTNFVDLVGLSPYPFHQHIKGGGWVLNNSGVIRQTASNVVLVNLCISAYIDSESPEVVELHLELMFGYPGLVFSCYAPDSNLSSTSIIRCAFMGDFLSPTLFPDEEDFVEVNFIAPTRVGVEYSGYYYQLWAPPAPLETNFALGWIFAGLFSGTLSHSQLEGWAIFTQEVNVGVVKFCDFYNYSPVTLETNMPEIYLSTFIGGVVDYHDGVGPI